MHGTARKQDFARLYSELGLRPGCSLSELKHAYRRRIAELHPDRGGMPAPRPGDTRLPLTDLIALYAAASDFHQRYGRLPGAPARRGLPLKPAPWRTAAPHAMASPAMEVERGDRFGFSGPSTGAEPEERGAIPFARTLIVAIVLIFLVLTLQGVWDLLISSDRQDHVPTPTGVVPHAPPRDTPEPAPTDPAD